MTHVTFNWSAWWRSRRPVLIMIALCLATSAGLALAGVDELWSAPLFPAAVFGVVMALDAGTRIAELARLLRR
jgi:hypothetical protein